MRGLILPIFLTFLAGVFVPIQTGANAYLGKGLGNGLISTFVVFIVASISALTLLLLQRPEIPISSQIHQIPWYAWTVGGILGTAYIFILIYSTPKLGMANVVGLVVLGQMVMAMVMDHFGWMGLNIHAFNWKRLLGAALMIVGLLVIKKY